MEHDPYNDAGRASSASATPPSARPAGPPRPGAARGQPGTAGRSRTLLTSFDRLRRDLDTSGTLRGLDTFHQQAMNVLTSRKLLEALDLSREDARVRERYGKGDPRVEPTLKAAPRLMEPLLAARRLVEAGARCVTVAFGAWDWHEKIFVNLKDDLPLFDQVSRRWSRTCTSAAGQGRVGRRLGRVRPQSAGQPGAGRDHWPAASCALLAGGGMRTGQVIGATDRLGERPRERPVHVQEVLATLYERAGVDLQRLTFPDFSGRPHALLDGYQPIRELG